MRYKDTFIDLASKDIEEDEFTLSDLFSFEDNLKETQQSFDADFDTFYGERSKDFKYKSGLEKFEGGEEIWEKQRNAFEESLKTFETEESKRKEKAETLNQLFEGVQKSKPVKNSDYLNFLKNTRSIQERFQSNLRKKSDKIRRLEESLSNHLV